MLKFSVFSTMMQPIVVSMSAAGGVISFVNQQQQGNLSFSILIPANFYNSPQAITINMFDENAIREPPEIRGTDREAQIAGPIFDINAASSTSNGTASLVLPYRSTKAKRGDETYSFRIYYFDPFTGIWTLSGASVDDKVSLTVSANTSHFSLWTVISTKIPPMKAEEEPPPSIDWRLALYIGFPVLGLIVIFFVARLILAKHKHIKNSRYEFLSR